MVNEVLSFVPCVHHSCTLQIQEVLMLHTKHCAENVTEQAMTPFYLYTGKDVQHSQDIFLLSEFSYRTLAVRIS